MELSPLLQYGFWPMAGVVVGLLLLCSWIGTVYWLTRKQSKPTLATLPASPIPAIDITNLKQQYLQQVDAIEKSYAHHEIRARTVHQLLSTCLRQFAVQAGRMPFTTMTLEDLKRTRYRVLADAVAEYYAPEFEAVETGSVAHAVQIARKVITEWS